MLKTRVIPCLLLKNLGLVKTVKFSDPKYIGDPINAVKIFNDKEVDELIFLDITATNEKRKPSFEFISRIAKECFMPFSYGGGIRSLEDIKEILRLGTEKVVINSYAFENPGFIKEASKIFGRQSIIASIDVKKNEVFTNSGTRPTGLNPVDYAIKMEQMGTGEIFLNSIDKDGIMEGYDLELVKSVSEKVNIPVIISGGAGKLEDFKKAINHGASAVSAGSMFVFIGKNRAVLINYPNQRELEQVLN